MSETALRRMLERATAEPPADLEGRVFDGRRHPWRWSGAAAAVVLVAAVLAWSLASSPSDSGLTGERTGGIGRYPIGATDFVATWLPVGFSESERGGGKTTWSGPDGATVTVGFEPQLDVPNVSPQREPLAPRYGAMRIAVGEEQWLTWCNSSACSLHARGVSELDAVRVAASVASRARLSSAGTSPPFGVGLQDDRPEGQRPPHVYRLTFDPTATDNEGRLLSQAPKLVPQSSASSVVTLTLGAAASYDGFDPVRSNGYLVGWVDTRLARLSGPKPVVSVVKDERLQGYLLPGVGFVWADALFTDSPSRTRQS